MKFTLLTLVVSSVITIVSSNQLGLRNLLQTRGELQATNFLASNVVHRGGQSSSRPARREDDDGEESGSDSDNDEVDYDTEDEEDLEDDVERAQRR